MPTNFRNQNYAALKKDCLSKGTLFEDPEFPANNKSLYYSKVQTDIEWMRPKELCKVPRLVVDGVSCDDLVTGDLKNAWFITACTALAHEPKLWNKVVPDVKTQEYDDKNPYAGIFKFNFWRFGEWIEVVIDDRLPTKDGKLVFLHSHQKNEFWSALLEKAYAKMFGDYETLGAGHASDALVDFTGGVSEKIDIKATPFKDPIEKKMFFNKLENACENKALMNCHIRVPESKKGTHTTPVKITDVDNGEKEVNAEEEPRSITQIPQNAQRTSILNSIWNKALQLLHVEPTLIGSDGPHGLVVGQGYNITLVKTIEVKKSLQGQVGGATLQMIRLFNPWGAKEWTGPWSDNSAEWKKVSQSEWEKMGVKFANEGEFWMCFDDFITYFTDCDICHFVNTSFFSTKKTWTESILFSEWSNAGRNGGNKYESATFLSNPQYLFDITTEEPDAIMISIEQRDVTVGRQAVGHDKNTIGFYIMKVEVNRQFRVHLQGEQMFRSEFQKSRNVFGTCNLAKGRYVVIPCCENPGAIGEFMLRLYTANKTGGKELTRECPTSGCCAKYKLVTTLTVEMLDGIELPENEKGTLDPYIVIRCEGEKIKTDYQKNTRSPQFNISATFYRKKPAEPIIVEVYSHNTVFDTYIAEGRINWPEPEPKEKSSSVDEKKKSCCNCCSAYCRCCGSSGDKQLKRLPSEERRRNEKGEKKVFNLYGRKKEADTVKPGNLHVFVRSSDDLQML